MGLVFSGENGLDLYRVSYNAVLKNLNSFVERNKRIKPLNVTKYADDPQIVWYELYDDMIKAPVAYVGINENWKSLDGVDDVYAATLFAISGKHYGMTLLKMVYGFYNNYPERTAQRFSFTVDPDAKISLFVNYFKNLIDDYDGDDEPWDFEILETEWWKSVRFYKYFD